jgi:uncharacterized protein (DUF4415 family)
MSRPKPASLSSLTVADLKALLAEKEIEDLKARQVALEADLRRVEKELARLTKGAPIAKSAPKRAKHGAAKPAKKSAGTKAAAKKAPATASIESVVIDLLKANGAPWPFPRSSLRSKAEAGQDEGRQFRGRRAAVDLEEFEDQEGGAGGVSGVRAQCPSHHHLIQSPWPQGGHVSGVTSAGHLGVLGFLWRATTGGFLLTLTCLIALSRVMTSSP